MSGEMPAADGRVEPSRLEDVVDMVHRATAILRPWGLSRWRHLDLTAGQLRVLVVVASEGGLPVGELADRVGGALADTGRIVERLVQAGVLSKVTDAGEPDRPLVEVTEDGAAAVRDLLAVRRQVLTEVLSAMDAAGLAALETGLVSLLQAATTVVPGLVPEQAPDRTPAAPTAD